MISRVAGAVFCCCLHVLFKIPLKNPYTFFFVLGIVATKPRYDNDIVGMFRKSRNFSILCRSCCLYKLQELGTQ